MESSNNLKVLTHEPGQTFEFSLENQSKVSEIIARYPVGREASAVLPLLDLAQRQSGGWLPSVAIIKVAEILHMPPIRVFEVASFYTMFNLKPVGAHLIQVCTTTPCWLRGGDELLAACKKHLQVEPRQVTKDGNFSYMEVECLGACIHAPMVQINDDYYEDLTPDTLVTLLDELKTNTAQTVSSKVAPATSKRTAVRRSQSEEA